jgi:hypothetical protein
LDESSYNLGKYTFADPREMLSEDGRAFTMLKDLDGTFLRYPVTEAEMEAAECDPNRVVHAVDRERRSKPPLD